MKTINQVVAAVTPGDAVSEQAFAWQRLLSDWGYEGRIVAEHVDPRLARQAHRLDDDGTEILRRGGAVLHYSVWSRAVSATLDTASQVALYYHNVTPGEFLHEFNPELARVCDLGRQHLPNLRNRVRPVLAVSDFNAEDLRAAGLGEPAVVPLLLDLPTNGHLRPPNRRPIILTVGRVAPNKCLEDVLRVFALYQRHRAPDAQLVVVGSANGFENYQRALDQLVGRLGLRKVVFTGPVSSQDRDAWYRRADAYVSMSLHEGFCAPIVEALAHGVPVVARGAGAIPETVGGAGLVLDGQDLPLVAEAIHEVASSTTTRTALAEAAITRLEEFRPQAVAARIEEGLAPFLEES